MNRLWMPYLLAIVILCIVWQSQISVWAQPNSTSISPYRIFVATSLSTPISGFIYNPFSAQNLSFEACILRPYPFCTDTVAGRRSNNSAMTNIGAISSFETIVQYDTALSSLIYVAADRRTIRRMAPDGSDRQIIYNTGQIILGSVAFDSASGTYFYITKWQTNTVPRLVDGRQAPIDSDDDLPHAVWMVHPKRNTRPVLLLKDMWTCRSLVFDPKSRILFFSNYTVSTEATSFAVETSLVLYSVALRRIVKSMVVDYTTTFSFPLICYERLFFDRKQEILFAQGTSIPRQDMQQLIWNNITYYALPSTFDWGAVFFDTQNSLVFREATGGRLVTAAYYRTMSDNIPQVIFSNRLTTIAMFTFTSIRAIGAVPCAVDSPNSCSSPFTSNTVGVTVTAIVFSALVVLGPCFCAVSAWYKSKYV